MKIVTFVCHFQCFSVQAQAQCASDQYEFTSCKIKGRETAVFVCYDEDVITYRYGAIGQPPELVISETIEDIDYRPWSGLGSTIEESVTFLNGEYSYEVVGGYPKSRYSISDEINDAGSASHGIGWVSVSKNGRSVAYLECEPETVTFDYGRHLADFKHRLGFEWYHAEGEWKK